MKMKMAALIGGMSIMGYIFMKNKPEMVHKIKDKGMNITKKFIHLFNS